jgi:hypothetical protein
MAHVRTHDAIEVLPTLNGGPSDSVSGKLLLAFASTVILASGPRRTMAVFFFFPSLTES